METNTRGNKPTACCPKCTDPRLFGTKKLRILTPHYLTTIQTKVYPQANHAYTLNHYYKTPHYVLQVGTHSFDSIGLLRPPLPDKAIKLFVTSVQFSRSVVSDSLQHHELQYTRSPCPSPTPRVYPNPYPLCR